MSEVVAQEEVIRELDKAVKLLDEYILRTKKIYSNILSKQRRRRFLVYGYFPFVFFTLILSYIFLRRDHREIDFGYIMVGLSAGLTVTGLVLAGSNIDSKLFFFSSDKDSSVMSLDLTMKQLMTLITYVSQYNEHNTNVGELTKMEVKLKLQEAEEIFRMVQRRVKSRKGMW